MAVLSYPLTAIVSFLSAFLLFARSSSKTLFLSLLSSSFISFLPLMNHCHFTMPVGPPNNKKNLPEAFRVSIVERFNKYRLCFAR